MVYIVSLRCNIFRFEALTVCCAASIGKMGCLAAFAQTTSMRTAPRFEPSGAPYPFAARTAQIYSVEWPPKAPIFTSLYLNLSLAISLP